MSLYVERRFSSSSKNQYQEGLRGKPDCGKVSQVITYRGECRDIYLLRNKIFGRSSSPHHIVNEEFVITNQQHPLSILV
jgi:hypothetical protein